MPTKEVRANPIGIVRSCDQNASLGVRAKRLKSGSFTIKVAKFAIALIMPLITAHAKALPCNAPRCLTMGPKPSARTTAQMKNAIPATGTTAAFTVKKCLILCTAGHKKGKLPAQNKKKLTKSRVLVPEDAGMEFLLPSGPYASHEGQIDRIIR